jgi:hypothetical protein
MLESSGLYGELVEAGLLVSHSDVDVSPPSPASAARVIRPEQIPFVSYPYEWCFGQLKDASLATLEIQLAALRHGMSLKDASAFNIQFLHGHAVLIDTLSFEQYEEGRPWVAYRQFCEHFLAPLMLISRVDPWLGRLSALTADGIPLQTASRLLPWTSRLRPAALLHLHLHARTVDRYGGRQVPDRVKSRGLSRRGMQNLIEGLQHTIDRLEWKSERTEWAEYEVEHGYASETMLAKRDAVLAMLSSMAPGVVWDLGANTGGFSRLVLETGASVISMDLDPAAVERNYRRMLTNGETALHPLWVDLRSPSPDIGWAEAERDGLTARANADCVLGLALVHHLALGGNVPLTRLLGWFSSLARHLIVEFVPKADPQVQRLLVSRQDVFPEYSRTGFEKVLEDLYEVGDVRELPSSGRVIYHGIRRAA